RPAPPRRCAFMRGTGVPHVRCSMMHGRGRPCHVGSGEHGLVARATWWSLFVSTGAADGDEGLRGEGGVYWWGRRPATTPAVPAWPPEVGSSCGGGWSWLKAGVSCNACCIACDRWIICWVEVLSLICEMSRAALEMA